MFYKIRTAFGYFGAGVGSLSLLAASFPFLLLAGIKPSIIRDMLAETFRIGCAILTRVYLPALGIYSIKEISGLKNANINGPVVYVANHRGRLDGPLLLGIIRNTGIIMKGKYARKSFFSAPVKHLDFISVEPGSINSLAEAAKKCSALINSGKSIIIFPEGARAATGKLLPFKDFAFRMTNNSVVPVVPVIIHSNLPFMAKIKGSHFPDKKFHYRIRFLLPVLRNPGEGPAVFSERIREIMTAELEKLDFGTVWETDKRKDILNAA
jgi:1-acyl-sn-glycerol-3-phosphate acyltransferase